MTDVDIDALRGMRKAFTRMMMVHQFGLDELTTKLNILRQEFIYLQNYNPIESISARLKSPESILQKAHRKGIPLTFEGLQEHVLDIAGVRIVCSFASDIYSIRDALGSQPDVKIVEVRDYIEHPKSNGYKSLHLIVEVPVFLSDRTELATVEVQIRTIAMDFWASLEHKIYYKYSREIPRAILDELKEAADSASELDRRMARLRDDVQQFDHANPVHSESGERKFDLPQNFLEPFLRDSARQPGG